METAAANPTLARNPTLDHPSEQKSLAGDPDAAKTRARRGWGTQFVFIKEIDDETILSVALCGTGGIDRAEGGADSAFLHDAVTGFCSFFYGALCAD
jgi:hypothetical protein